MLLMWVDRAPHALSARSTLQSRLSGHHLADWQSESALRIAERGPGPAVVINMEQDIAAYTVMAIGDARVLNKQLHIRPPLNMLSQHDLIYIHEDKVFRQLCIGNRLVRSPVTEAELDAQIAGALLLKDRSIAAGRNSMLASCMRQSSLLRFCHFSDCVKDRRKEEGALLRVPCSLSQASWRTASEVKECQQNVSFRVWN